MLSRNLLLKQSIAIVFYLLSCLSAYAVTPGIFFGDGAFNLNNGAAVSGLLSVSDQDVFFPEDLVFSTDGLRLFVIDRISGDISQYSLSNSFDITTASFDDVPGNPFSVLTQEESPRDLAFSPDGLRLFVIGSAGDEINQYNLNIPFDITTASFDNLAGNPFSVVTEEVRPNALSFSTDGLRLLVTGDAGDDINQYNLSTPFDITTASFDEVIGNPFSVASQEPFPEGLTFNSDGSRLFVVGSSGFSRSDINQYNLTTPFDITTASFDDVPGNPFSVLDQDFIPTGVSFSTDGSRLFISGDANNAIVQYDLPLTGGFTETLTNNGAVDGSLLITLTNDTFAAGAGNALDGSDFTVNNVPPGLIPTITVDADNASMATLSLNGNAAFNDLGNSVSSLDINFAASAFTNGQSTADLVNPGAADTGFGVEFFSVETTFNGGFNETQANSGAVSGSLVMTLNGDSFAAGTGNPLSASDFAISNLPAGLTPTITVDAMDASVATLSLNGNATFNNSSDSVGSLNISFAASAFSGGQDIANLVNLSAADTGAGVIFLLNPSMTFGEGGFDISNGPVITGTFSVQAQEFGPSGLTFSPDGLRLFVIGFSDDEINQYNLSTPFDITTASFDDVPGNPFSTAAQETGPADLTFSRDGQRLFVIGTSGDDINQYSLSAPFDITTASFDDVPGNPFSIQAQELVPFGLSFSPDGLRLFVIGSTGDDINQYSLGTPFDITTASLDDVAGNPFSVVAQEGSPQGLVFSSDGLRLLVIGSDGDDINQYNLSTPFDITTASFDNVLGNPFSVQAQDFTPTGLSFSPDGARLFIIGSSSDSITQYDLPLTGGFTETLVNGGAVDGSLLITLTGDTFAAGSGNTLADSDFIVNNLPTGLMPIITVDAADASMATLSLTGNAASNDLGDSISSLDINFAASAFANGQSTADLVNPSAADTGFGVEFFSVDIAFNGGFAETQTNNGAVDGSLLITLIGDTFAAGTGNTLAGSDFIISNLPVGLIPTITVDAIDASVATLTLAGNANFNNLSDGVGSLNISLADSVFSGGQGTANLVNPSAADTGVGITFLLNPSITFGEGGFDISNDAAVTGAFSVAAREPSPQGLAFTPDGLRLFVIGSAGDEINQYSLSIPFNITTASFDDVPGNPFSVVAQEAAPTGLSFSPDGLRLFVIGIGDDINQYSLGRPFDITTASFDSIPGNPFSVITEVEAPTGLSFSPDGLRLLVLGAIDDDINQYNLSTPFDITTASFDDRAGNPFSVQAQEFTPTGLTFSPDGLRLFVIGASGDEINQYNLSTPFDITTASFDDVLGNPFSVQAQESNPTDLSFSTDGSRLLITGSISDSIFQYDLTLSGGFTETLVNDGAVDGSLLITLIGDTFAAGTGNTLASSDFIINNLPAGLMPTITVDAADASIATLSLAGNATSNDLGDSISSLDINVAASAFANGQSTADLVNPSAADTGFGVEFFSVDIAFSGGFTETQANNGTVDGNLIITLNGDSFIAGTGNPLTTDDFTISNLPAGLMPTITVDATNASQAILTLAGNANPNNFINNVSSLSIILAASAFTGGQATANEVNPSAADTGVGITFLLNASITFGEGVFDISNGATFTGSFSVSPQESSSQGLTFSPDGQRLFVIGSSGDDINQYSLSNPFDITTASFDDVPGNPFSIADQQTIPTGLTFSPDGRALFVIGDIGDSINQYSLNAPFDITTASFDDVFGNPFSVAAQETGPGGLTFSPDGLRLFVIGSVDDEINQYNLSAPFDITTASFDDVPGNPFSVQAQESTPTGLSFSRDGLRLFVIGANGDEINQYNLSTPFDITTTSFDNVTGNPYSVQAQEPAPTGLSFSADGSRLFIVGSSSDRVVQYDLSLAGGFIETQANNGAVDGSLAITLTGDTFAAGTGNTLAGSDFTISNLPVGLIPTITVDATNASMATLSLGGNATFNDLADSISSLDINFAASVFTNGQITANQVNPNAADTGFGVEFFSFDINFNGGFTETQANNGAVDGSLMMALNGDNFAAGTGNPLSTSDFFISNIPAGLIPTITVDAGDASQAILTLAGNANPNSLVNSVSSLNISFSDSAFAGGQVTANDVNPIAADTGVRVTFLLNASITFGDNVFDIANGAMVTGSFSVQAQVSTPADLSFSPDGLRLFVLDSFGDDINQYNLGSPFDITTASLDDVPGNPFSISPQDNTPTDLSFSPDGLRLFVIGGSGDDINQYNLTTPFDITTAAFDNVPGNPFSIAAQETGPGGLTFSPDGLRLFVIGSADDEINQYNLSVPFDITTASFDDVPGNPFSIADQETAPTGLTFSQDGRDLFVIGASGDEINQYNLSTPFDITTASFDNVPGNPFSVQDQESVPTGLSFSADGSRLFIVGSSSDNVVQYDLSLAGGFTETLVNNGAVDGSLLITLTGDTFAAGTGNTLAGSNFAINNLPAGLTPTITVDASDASIATLTLAGNAIFNDLGDSITSLDINFAASVFSNGQTTANQVNPSAADTGFGVEFFSADITFNGDFIENQANNGTVGGSMVITLNGDDFAAGTGNPLAASDFAISNLPAGLFPFITVDAADASQAMLTLTGIANPNSFINNVSSLNISFAGSAFSGGQATANEVNPSAADTGVGITFLLNPSITFGEGGFDLSNGAAITGSFSVNSQESFPEDLSFSLDGLRLFVTGDNNREINQYTLSVPFDINTASFDNVPGNPFSIAEQQSAPDSLTFSPDGLRLFVIDSVGDEINQYNLSIAFDITTASFDDVFGNPFSVVTQESSPQGLAFSPDGLRLFVIGSAEDEINQYSLSVPFDITTANFDEVPGNPFSVTAQASFPQGLTFSPDGLRLFVIGSAEDEINQYSLSSPFDITTASFDNVIFSVAAEESVPNGLRFSPDGSRLFIIGALNRGILQYDLPLTGGFTETPANDGAVDGSLLITLTGDTFAAGTGNALAESDFSISNLPDGLIPTITVDASNASQATLTLAGNATFNDLDESISSLSISFAGSAFTGGQGTANLVNPDAADTGFGIDFLLGPANLSITGDSVIEGDTGSTMLNFAVNLSSTPDMDVSVDFTIIPGTAMSGEDFIAQTGTLTFGAGRLGDDLIQVISVVVNSDALFEADETLSVQLSNPVNALIAGNPTTTGAILNDDPNNPPTFVIGNDQMVMDNDGSQTVLDFVTDIEDGDPEVVQTVSITTSNNNSSLFSVQPEISNGDLTYTPALGANGIATITVTATDDGPDTPPNNNSSSQTFSIEIVATSMVDVAIIKSNGAGFVTGEDNITYLIEVINLGADDAEAMVVDLLTNTLLDPMWECTETIVGSGATCTPGPVFGDIVDSIFLPAGTSVMYTLTVTPDVTTADTVSNTATATVTSDLPDIDTSNNTSTDSDPVADVFADDFEAQ